MIKPIVDSKTEINSIEVKSEINKKQKLETLVSYSIKKGESCPELMKEQ